MHRSQRTGAATWSTSRPTNSGPWCDRRCRRRSTAGGCRARTSAGRRPAAAAARPPGPCGGVERAGHRQRPEPRAFGRVGGEGGELLGGAGRDDLAGRVDVGGGEAEFGQLGQHRVGVAAEDAVMPVGLIAAALAIARPRSRTSTSADSGESTPASAAAVISPTLWPATAADVACDVVEGARQPTGRLAGDAELRLPVREKHRRGGQTGTDEQRLGDRGVFDLVGVGGGAEAGQIEIENRRPPGHRIGDAREFEPGREKAGNLGALTGGEEREHEHPPCRLWPGSALSGRTKSPARPCREPTTTRSSGECLPVHCRSTGRRLRAGPARARYAG